MTALAHDDVRCTAGGVPVFQFEYEPGAPLYLVTVDYLGERRRSWVIGSPLRLVRLAGDVLRQRVIVERRDAIDESVLAVEGTG
jgi:hypothetical protein